MLCDPTIGLHVIKRFYLLPTCFYVSFVQSPVMKFSILQQESVCSTVRVSVMPLPEMTATTRSCHYRIEYLCT